MHIYVHIWVQITYVVIVSVTFMINVCALKKENFHHIQYNTYMIRFKKIVANIFWL